MLIIYGGSFNPPTVAHQEIVNKLKNEFPNAKIIIMPVSQNNYFWKDNLASDTDRYNMLKLAFPNEIISDYEFSKKEYKGTYNMLNDFKQIDKDIYFVVGSDNVKQMPEWANALKLVEEYKIIVIKRPTDVLDFSFYYEHKSSFILIDMNSVVNASLIRKDVHKYNEWLDKKVYDYIVKNEIYEV